VTIPSDVLTWIAAHFRENDRETAIALLSDATDESDNPVGPRLIRCAALASTGDLDKLRGLIQLLRIDWRDVIGAAEYEERAGVLVQIRDLNRPIPDA
jgi:hypothetical protein